MEDSVEGEFLQELNKSHHDKDKDSSSSSDSEIDHYSSMLHSSSKKRLFGRQKPLHLVLGGGKSADIILWRNNKTSGCIFCGVTVIWLLFECIGYHLLTFVCHSLILLLATMFVWSNVASFINVPPPEFPEVKVPEEMLRTVLLWIRGQAILTVATLREVASGKDLKQFLMVIVVLWFISVVSSWFSFLTLFYLLFVILQLVPMLYEKHEDTVDTYAEKGLIEIKKQYAALDEKFLHKIPILSSLKDKKQH